MHHATTSQGGNLMASDTSRLTDRDRELIARAREVGPGLRASNSDRDRLAGWLLAEMASAIERLAGQS